MGWLQNISFSSSSTSPSSSSASAATPVTSPKKQPQDNNDGNYFYNQRRQSQRSNTRHSYLGFRIAGSKLTRQRELRRPSEQEIPFAKEVATPLSRSRSSYDTPLSAPAATTSKAATSPVPLPLPLPVREGDGEQRLPSLNDFGHVKGLEDRDREKADGTPSNSSMFPSRESKKTEHVETRSSSKVLHQEVYRGDSSQDDFKVYVPIRSAPTSPFCSPIISPHRKSTGELFLPYMVPPGKQVWSAPEMATLDHPGLPPPAFYDYTAFSTDNTPIHSPPNRSPRQMNRSQSEAASSVQPKLSLDIASIRPESNCPINVHPLPLPPGAAIASPSATLPQVTAKPEPLAMKCQWQKGKLIGRGTFGSVYVGSNRETGALCAMKEVEIFPDDPKSAECIKQLEQEIKILSQLKHPNIVQYYGSEIVEDKFYIYLEYVHPGSINKYVRDHFGAITESVVRNFTRHILSGLAYLHSTKTIHRDIKGANLLVDAYGVVKLADFGMSKHLSGQRADLSLKGSPYWMAPELMQAVMQKDNSSDLALAVDIWSLGCTIIEMFTGKAPWSEYEGAAAMFKVMRDTPAIPETLSAEGKDFLRCCFRRNPAERSSASVLLEHPFLKTSQQLGASSSTSIISGIKSLDIALSPRERSEIKPDQLAIQQSLRSSKHAPPESETAQRSSDLTMTTRYSPRSTLEPLPSLSPPRTAKNTHPTAGTIKTSLNHESKKNHTFR